MTSFSIKNFIDKVRLANSSKSKDLRLTIEEANDLVSWIAMIQINSESIELLHTKIDKLTKASTPIYNEQNPKMDGGKFK